MLPVTFEDYSFTYALGKTPALKNIRLTVNPGEVLTLCGASGSGKSTLLRSLKKASAPAGKSSGTLSAPDDRDTAIVFQNPETQLVMTRVIDDLVFQMENRGMEPSLMRKRLSETVAFFGIEPWLHREVQTLSGGQKQLAAICAALMCEPELLLLDEPVSQLDPLAGAALMETVSKLNRELGVTVIIAEHRLDECVGITDRIAFMEDGRLRYAGGAGDALRFLYGNGYEDYVPALPRASMMLDGRLALTPKEFRGMYTKERIGRGNHVRGVLFYKYNQAAITVRLRDITFGCAGGGSSKKPAVLSPSGDTRPVLHRLDFTASSGELICLLGGNGSGKSTLLKLMAKIIKPVLGKIAVNGKIGYMPQNAADYFLRERVRDDIDRWDSPQVQAWAEKLNIAHLGETNPFDLSGGEQQKAALLAILSREPNILLLDEPTKGMDPAVKKVLAGLLAEFKTKGGTVIIATHDMEFAACYAGRCAMLFDGEIVNNEPPRTFFAGNKYYTTAIHKGLRHINPFAVTVEDVKNFGNDYLWDL